MLTGGTCCTDPSELPAFGPNNMGLISEKAEVSQSSLPSSSVSPDMCRFTAAAPGLLQPCRFTAVLQVYCSSTKLLLSKGSVVVLDDVNVGRNSSLRQGWVSGRYVQDWVMQFTDEA